VTAVLVEDVVFDINSIEGLPEDDSASAIVGHHVVVDFHVGNSGIAGYLKTVAGVGEEDIVEDYLVIAAEVESVVQVAAGASIVMNVVGAVDIAAGAVR